MGDVTIFGGALGRLPDLMLVLEDDALS